jgi:hypothetical protein
MSESDDYLHDRSGPADPEVARLEALLAPLAHDRPLDELRLRRRPSRAPWIAGALALIAAAAVLVLVLGGAPTGQPEQVACAGNAGFRFSADHGTVACGGTATTSGVLPVGGVLETGTNIAELAIADIGTARLFAGSRVRLDRTGAHRHQLHLERGKMHAQVTAPPRMFAVTTPSTGVTDLGCEYTIEIDAAGRGWIEVQTGKVELDNGDGKLIVAPGNTTARLLAGRRPSLPVAWNASAALRGAVADYERGVVDAIPRLLTAATPADAITVANLAVLAPAPARASVLARLAELVPPPAGVTVELAAAEPAALERWRDEVVIEHLGDALLPDKKKSLPN